MDDLEVPPFFICPISLLIMKDPVTISTGMTFDRESIQKWLFSYKNKTCPITQQPLTNHTITPNSTLLRLIESWRINNPSKPSTKIQTPRPASEVFLLLHNLVEFEREPTLQIKSLRKIQSLIKENGENKTYMEEAGIASFIASLIIETDPQGISQFSEKSIVGEEATTVMNLLELSTETLKKVSQDTNGLLIQSLSLILQHGSYQARIQAALLLKSIFKVVDNIYKASLKMELFEGITEILKDQNSKKITMAVLAILMEVVPIGRNQIKAVEAGMVTVLVELLAESNDKRYCEIMLEVLKQLCERAEGRSEFLVHPASVAVVVSKILRVSYVADDKAVMLLLLICRFCMSNGVAQELIEVGGVVKLCMVMQSEIRLKTKERTKEILGFHLKAWNKSPCFTSYKIL